MGFVNDRLAIQRHSDNEWVLTESLLYFGQRHAVYVPVGFVTDFASVPRVAVWLVPRFGRYTAAAIVHDWLCVQLASEHPEDRHTLQVPIDSRDTDGLFRRIMREQGVPWLLRWLVWCGVRWGALANPHRRAGWWRDLHKILPLSVLAVLIMLPAGIGICYGLILYWLLERVTPGGAPDIEVTT